MKELDEMEKINAKLSAAVEDYSADSVKCLIHLSEFLMVSMDQSVLGVYFI